LRRDGERADPRSRRDDADDLIPSVAALPPGQAKIGADVADPVDSPIAIILQSKPNEHRVSALVSYKASSDRRPGKGSS